MLGDRMGQRGRAGFRVEGSLSLKADGVRLFWLNGKDL